VQSEQKDIFYYMTHMNENYANPDLPEGAAEGVLRGGYHYGSYVPQDAQRVTLLGSGAMFTEVIQAAQKLAEISKGVDVYSITSWSQLARDGMENESEGAQPYLAHLLKGSSGPILAATDYVRALPETVRAYLPADRAYRTLGTDGFGRSVTRVVLRSFFQVDAKSIQSRAMAELGLSA